MFYNYTTRIPTKYIFHKRLIYFCSEYLRMWLMKRLNKYLFLSISICGGENNERILAHCHIVRNFCLTLKQLDDLHGIFPATP